MEPEGTLPQSQPPTHLYPELFLFKCLLWVSYKNCLQLHQKFPEQEIFDSKINQVREH